MESGKSELIIKRFYYLFMTLLQKFLSKQSDTIWLLNYWRRTVIQFKTAYRFSQLLCLILQWRSSSGLFHQSCILLSLRPFTSWLGWPAQFPVREDKSRLPAAIWFDPLAIASVPLRTWVTMRMRFSFMSFKASISWPVSSFDTTLILVVKSPEEKVRAILIALFKWRVTLVIIQYVNPAPMAVKITNASRIVFSASSLWACAVCRFCPLISSERALTKCTIDQSFL